MTDYDDYNEDGRKRSRLSRLANGKPGLANRWGRYVGLRVAKKIGRRLARGRIRREAKKIRRPLLLHTNLSCTPTEGPKS